LLPEKRHQAAKAEGRVYVGRGEIETKLRRPGLAPATVMRVTAGDSVARVGWAKHVAPSS
jgi:hypothetical protein